MKMLYNNGKFYRTLNEFAQGNSVNNQRLSNLQQGSIILMENVDIINANGTIYTETNKRPYAYLGKRTILSCDKNNQLILQDNQDIIDELETHNGLTYAKDSNGKYIYEPEEYEATMDNTNTTNLRHRSMAQGISYAKFPQNQSVSFVPVTMANNVEELIRNLEKHSNILIESLIDIENLKIGIELNFNYNNIFVEK